MLTNQIRFNTDPNAASGGTPAGGDAKPPVSPPPANQGGGSNGADKGTSNQAKEYEEIIEANKVLFDPAVSDERKIAATRKILSKAHGWDDAKIDQYLQDTFGNPSDTGDDADSNRPTPNQQPNRREGESEEAKRLKELEAQNFAIRRRNLERDINDNIDSQVRANDNVTKFIKNIERIKGKDGLSEAKKKLEDRVKAETIRILEQQKAERRGYFDEGWIPGAAKKAADTVVSEYLSVIGDLDRLGRTPETVTGEQEFLKSKAVEPPKYTKGMRLGDADTAIRNFNVDALSRLALSTDSGADKI